MSISLASKLGSKRAGILTIWLIAFLAVALNMALSVHFMDRVYPGVKVGAISLGGLTRAEASQVLEAQSKAYHLSLTVDSAKYNVKPENIGARYDVGLTTSQAFAAGRSEFLPIVGMVKAPAQAPSEFAYSLDRRELANFVSTLVSQQAAAPVDASIVVTAGVPTVQSDKSGLGINKEALLRALQVSLVNQTDSLRVERGPIPADVTVAKAEPAVATAKQLIATSLTITYSGKQFSPTPADIGSWLVFIKQDAGTLVPQVDIGRVKAYFSSFASQVEVAPVTKEVSVVNGQVKGETGGTDGLAIDRDTLAAQVAAAVMATKPAALSVPTVAVAYRTTYNRTISLDAAQYIEVNLTTQTLWAYQDHQVAYTSPVTSGATGYGFPTVQGLFSIYAKETNRYLDGRPLGYHYNVFVQYWMPFYADYGLHDASWRNGQFGGTDYYYNGSHGCVNLPVATAAWLYGWASIGTPVWVHS